MEAKLNKVTINGKTYVAEDGNETSVDSQGLQYVLCRTYSAGVHAGWLVSQEDKRVELRNARRLWYWAGAASLSQLSQEGVKKPDECKFPCEVPSITLTEAIEIIPCTNKARLSIAGVPVWSA